MLSSGVDHVGVPRDEAGNLRYREACLADACGDEVLQRALWEVCRNDILFWINVFVYQHNPLKINREVGSFVTWDFQDEAIMVMLECIETGQDLRIEKSREMGASWLCLIVMLWLCLFHEDKTFLVVSKDADSVDRPEDPGALLWKVRFILARLPDWMNRGTEPRKMGVKFNRTNSVVYGSASTGKFSIGGRATAIFVDEFSLIDEDVAVFEHTRSTSNCRIFNFTHRGTDKMAYTLCYDARYMGMRSLKMHWSQHPLKRPGAYKYDAETGQIEIVDKEHRFPPDYHFVMDGRPTGGPHPGLRSVWYDKITVGPPPMGERAISMDLDMDPRGATDQFFNSFTINTLIAQHARASLWRGNVVYDKETGKGGKFVLDPKGSLRLWVRPVNESSLPVMRLAAAVDVSAGTGSTPSCLSMFNATTGQTVAEYENNMIYPPDFAVLVAAFCWMARDEYGSPPLLAWEIQGGQAFARRMIDQLHYENYYIRRDEDALGRPRDVKMRAGFNASLGHILKLMTEYRDALYGRECLNLSESSLDDCLNIVYEGNSVAYKARGVRDVASAEGVHHGDMVRANALAWKMVREIGFKPLPERQAAAPTVFSVEGRRQMRQAQARRDLSWA